MHNVILIVYSTRGWYLNRIALPRWKAECDLNCLATAQYFCCILLLKCVNQEINVTTAV